MGHTVHLVARRATIADSEEPSIDEAAARLRVSVCTVRYLRQEGRFAPATRVGRRLFWDEADVESWLLKQKESA